MRALATTWTILVAVTLVAVTLAVLGIWTFMTTSSSWLVASFMLVESAALVGVSIMLMKDSRWY
jgi:hypothetical protein